MNNDKQAVTVDTPEFRNLAMDYRKADAFYSPPERFLSSIIAYIDRHTSAAVARAVEFTAESQLTELAHSGALYLPNEWADAWHALRDDVLSGVDGLDNDQVNTILGMLDNYEPVPKIQPAAQAAAPVAASETIPQELRDIGDLLRTQDNRITDQPMFIVQQRRRITGLDTDFCENIVWLRSEDGYSEADKEKHNSLEAEYQETGRQPAGWLRTGYSDEWEFVTACFTEQGCKDYLARDGHNLNEPRIYADGSYRNAEFRAVRNWLMSLAAHTQPPAAVPAEPTRANAGPEPGDMPIDRFIASVPLPMYDLKEPPAGELPVLPEPVDELAGSDGFNVIGTVEVFTADQMREYGRLCRAAGIEEVAKLIDKETGWGWLGTQNCYQINASAIRALKGGE